MPAISLNLTKHPDVLPAREGACSGKAASAAGKVEFIPKAVEPADGDRRPQMPILPLHLLKGEHDPCSAGMSKSLSACSLDSCMSVGGGFSDTASMASLAFGGSIMGDMPPSLRTGELPAVPSCFKCKYSHQVMQHPVRLPDGTTCERANIVALRLKGEVKPDPLLAEAIKSYFELRKESERLQKEWHAWVVTRNKRAQEKSVHRQRQIYALRVALDQSRKKVTALEEKHVATNLVPNLKASVNTTPESSHREDVSSETVEASEHGSPTAHEASAAAPHWRSGPAPRSEATTPATRKASERRRSTWTFLKAQSP